MLTFDKVIQTDFGSYVRGFCLPTDEKPVTGIANGSMLEEINPESGVVDTYRFDGENAEWVKIISDGTPSGGGSGGGGSGGVLVVNATATEEEGVSVDTLDKTWKQIFDADYVVVNFARTDDDYRGMGIVGAVIRGSSRLAYVVEVYAPYQQAGQVAWEYLSFITNNEDGYPEHVYES